MKCELINYKQNNDETYLLSGILINDSLYFAHVWMAQTDEYFKILDADHLQVYAFSAFTTINIIEAENLIEQTIRKNRLNMLLDLPTSDTKHDKFLLQLFFNNWLEIY